MKSKSVKLTLTLLFTAVLLVGLLVGLSLVTSAAAPASVAVGPIENLQDDYYTASGTTGVTLVEPGGGYAYYNDGVLELNNYTYAGYGEGDDGHGGCYVISSDGDLTVRLVGNNTLTAGEGGIFTHGNLTITGDGTLTIVGDIDTYSSYTLRIEGGIIHATASGTVIGGNATTIELTGGSVTAVCTGTAPAFGGAPDVSGMSGAILTASVSSSGTPTTDYTPGNVSTYHYLRVSESRTASFNANTGTGTMAPVTAEYGIFRLPECTFTPPTGKRFKAWAVHSTSGTQVAAGERFDILSNMTFYAIWEDDTVTYYYIPGEAEGSSEFDEIVKGGTLELPDCMFEAPAGKQFAYWQIGNPAVATKYPGDEITINDETYIIAIWEALVYDVNFDANGGTGTMAALEGVATPYTLPNCTFVAPAGKQFKCWALGSAEGARYNAGTEIDLTGDTTLYAIWEDIPVTCYTVTFYANGGTGTMTPVTVPAGEYEIPACTFTAPTGKFFTAWAQGSPNGLAYYEGDTYMLTADTAFYALWEYEYYGIMIGNAEVTAENNTDVFGDGKVSYDPATKTLTLNGYSYTGEGMGIGDSPRVLIGAAVSGLAIRLEGNNTITGTHAKSMALVLEGATTITGSGTLTITTPYMAIFNESMGLLTIADGTLDLTVTGNAEQAAALVAHKLAITGGTLKVNSTRVGVYTATAENLSITGGDITVSVTNAGMAFVIAAGMDPDPNMPDLDEYDGATLTVSVNADGTEAGAYNESNLATYKYVSIKTPTAPGGGGNGGDNGGGNNGGNNSGNNGGNNGGNTGNGGDTGNNGGNTNTDAGNNTGSTNTDNTNTGNTDTNAPADTKEDDKEGLGAGVIVAITLGSTVVGGCGIFALIWFAIKKKTWAELVAIFKK